MAILAAIDNTMGSRPVIETAEELASGLGHDLTIIHVMPEGDDEETTRETIEDIVSSCLTTDLSPTIDIVPEAATRDVPSGRIAESILSVTEELDPAYLVLGSRKRTPVGKVLLGSVSQPILIEADVPVVTVGQGT